MRHHNHQEPLPEARSPGVILDRALAAARQQEQPRGWLREALLELADPRTVVEIVVIPSALFGLVCVILGGLGG